MIESTNRSRQAVLHRRSSSAFILATTLLGMAIALATNSAVQADVRTVHSSLVSENASFLTPGALDGRVEAIAVEGDTVFVGGTFTQIQQPLDGEIINQAYLFAYSKSTGQIIRDFDPILNNSVLALQTTGEGTGIFVGGAFTSINGEANRKGLLKLDNSGDRVSGFSARPNKRVFTMDRSGDTLYIGGNFDRISQSSVEYLAAIDTATGTVLPNINLDFDGVFSGTRTTGFPSVDVLEVTSDNNLMVVVGNFRTINGAERSRLAVLELGDQATVSTWNTNVYASRCPGDFAIPQYVWDVGISPDDSYFLTGSRAFRIVDNPACDAINRFDLDDLTNTDVQPTWTNYTGGDSVYEVAATEHAVYVGGHFRWLNNNLSFDGRTAGPGAVARRGLAALDPLNGLPILDWRSDRNPRGAGINVFEVQPEGLYIGDDTDFLNGFEHRKLKFLPLTTATITRPSVPTLPTTIFDVNFNSGLLSASPFDGTTLGSGMTMPDNDWANARGAMFLGGRLFHADDNGNMWVSVQREDGSLAPRTQVDLLGLTRNEWDLARLGGMFFDHVKGRVYYTLENDPRLFWRAFTPEGPIFGENEFVAEQQGEVLWSDVRGMDVIDGQLYYARSDGNLFRTVIDEGLPVPFTTVAVSGPFIDGRNWTSRLLAFSSDGTALPQQDNAQVEFNAAGSATFKSFRKFSFDVMPGEPVNVRLTWDDPTARLNVFLRDSDGRLIDSNNDINGNSPKWLFAPAGDGGTYTVAVKIQQGSTAYTVSVNPSEAPPEQPEPRADFEFTSFGSVDAGRWQVFNFDVEAGDLVEAQVEWDDPSGSVRVFLRDETRTLVDRDTDFSGSPEMVSTTALSSGRWSVAVRIETGAIDYDVLVNTTSP